MADAAEAISEGPKLRDRRYERKFACPAGPPRRTDPSNPGGGFRREEEAGLWWGRYNWGSGGPRGRSDARRSHR